MRNFRRCFPSFSPLNIKAKTSSFSVASYCCLKVTLAVADSLPPSMAFNRIQVIQELLRGRDSANKLQKLVNQSSHHSISQEDLVTQILDSFANTISILQNPPYHINWDGLRSSEDSGESVKISKMRKDRRAFHKRRKSSNVWTTETDTLVDDGFAWRKYGQKDILKAKHPRSYFRCTHKNDQGCQATKQVQKIEDDPPLYRITYSGNHTCKNPLNASHELMMEDSTDSTSILLSFNTSNTAAICKQEQHTPFSISFSSTTSGPFKNIECKEEIFTAHNQSSSSSDYLVAPDLTTFDSCTASTDPHCLDQMGVIGESMSVGFDDVFSFEF